MQFDAEVTAPVSAGRHLEARAGGTEILSRLRPVVSTWWIAFSASAMFAVTGHLLIKAGINNAAAALLISNPVARVIHLLCEPEVATGLLIYLAGAVCWMIAVAQKDISFLYPLSSINYVLILIASALVLHEGLSVRRAAGVAVIVSGMLLLNVRSSQQ